MTSTLDCPHCGSKSVVKNPRHERMYFCADCIQPAMLDTHEGVTGLRVVVKSDHGRHLSGLDLMAWWRFAVLGITAKTRSNIK